MDDILNNFFEDLKKMIIQKNKYNINLVKDIEHIIAANLPLMNLNKLKN